MSSSSQPWFTPSNEQFLNRFLHERLDRRAFIKR